MQINIETPFKIKRDENGKMEEPVGSFFGFGLVCSECDFCSETHADFWIGLLFLTIIIKIK